MNKSFTLIEILVVIVVIGILSAFILVGINSITDSANVAKGQAFINSMDNSLLLAKVSQWKLDGNTNDSWGTNTGTITGATTATNCVQSSCYSFDGNDFISYGTTSSFDFGNGTSDDPFSLSGWCKMTDATSSGLVGRFTNPSYQYSFYSGSSDKPTFILYDADLSNFIARRSAAITSYENQWINLTATYDGLGITGMKIYLNGVRVDFADLTSGSYTAMESSSVNFYIGAGAGTYMNGQIDDVRVYNQAIPALEIQQNYFIGLNDLFKDGKLTQIEFNQRIVELKSNLANNE